MTTSTEQDQIAALTADRDHWKANHGDIVKRKALLEQRPDLPVDRLPAYREMKRLQAENATLKADTGLRPVASALGSLWKMLGVTSQADTVDALARLKAAHQVPDNLPDDTQDWGRQDGAVAYHLIDRHGENWADIGNKMETWARAWVASQEMAAVPLPAVAPTPAFPPRDESKPAEQQGMFKVERQRAVEQVSVPDAQLVAELMEAAHLATQMPRMHSTWKKRLQFALAAMATGVQS